ncbi:thioredoxin family protein [Brevibacillus reuszeri]|uniref:thioredoxin family protein n=1 Tax=Brevibacillus reuszeri TaxID=54915 RepID=UPI0028983C96|nr:thioredoxin family protein [Brevibacillus reuszeri]
MAIHEATADNYKDIIKEGFVIVDFYSETCSPCKVFSKILDNIEFEIPFVNIVKVNGTKYPELSEEYGIQAVPTVLFYKDNVIVERHLGVIEPEQLKEMIVKYMY